MNDGFFGTFERSKSAVNERVSGRGEYLNGDIFRNEIVFYKMTGEVEFGLGGGGEPDFNFFEADINEGAEHAQFAGDVHGFYKSLVAVAKVGAEPGRCGSDGAIWPSAIWQVDGCECLIFGGRVNQHGMEKSSVFTSEYFLAALSGVRKFLVKPLEVLKLKNDLLF